MSIDSRQSTEPLRLRLAVPWLTVLPLAVVLAYADGFWMLTLRGAVGAIERTQQPFATWWRESTISLPLYVLAVLGALTLALRWFGPLQRNLRTVIATSLLVVTAGTAVGVAEIVGSSAYDYYLEADQLAMMDSMHGICVGSCLDQAQQSTLAAVVRAVLYTGAFMLITNLVLVGWMVAIRGGRLSVASTGQRVESDGDRAMDLRTLMVAALIGSAAIHAAVIPDHLDEWIAAGAFFVALTAAEVVVAAMLATRPHRRTLFAVVAISALPLAIWLCSRSAGLPFGPAAGQPEPVGLADIVCCVLEVVTLLVACLLLRRSSPMLIRGPGASAHVRSLALLTILAVTAIGLAAAAPTWFDGPGGQSEMIMPQ